MCGIVGFSGKESKEILKRMNDEIFHRGPDEEGFYQDKYVNLASRRLSIIDVLSGKQPIHNETKSIWLVWNGEIYNFKELRNELLKKGHKFYTDHSDSETIVHLYEEYGIDFINKINGMFAIALWDSKNKELILIRDRMGQKPLFYSFVNNEIIFSSEIKGILKYPYYKKEPNFEALNHYFTFKNIPAPFTPFKNIYSLFPGEVLIFDVEKKKKKQFKYWEIDFLKTNNDNIEEITYNIRNLLEDSVKKRMISDVPIGAYLSGGLDSSSVVSIMSKYSNSKIKTFSLGYTTFLEHKNQDIIAARKISNILDTDHYEYFMSPQELIDDLPNVLRSFDAPFSGAISTFFLTKLISKHVKVALSGDGADELFGSYLAPRLSQPLYYFEKIYKKIKSGYQLSNEDKIKLKPFENNIKFLENLYLKSNGNFEKWKYEILLFKDEEKKRLLNNGVFEYDKFNSFDLLKKDVENLKALDPLNRALELEWKTLLPDHVLAFVDFLSMVHSVEVRSPFLDYRLVEYVASLPGNLKIKNGNIKDILKKSLKGILPDKIINRKKEGFVLPVFWWLKNELKSFIFENLNEHELKNSVFNYEYVKFLLDSYYNNKENDFKLAAKIWNIVSFKIWWDLYFK
ncbi:asparagine synthase (glutamine-hydrolyzing) [Marinitoga aeolica]|uniref:asparagine synthase (glutamine-hydrolyzing) n=1 Tax=Marinitoga aeolica TaxID=2809031 RepID=A0ABY8PSW5_9BACT|nr:asparagine synthase (glutamine-hydrolyzing) [Marinitoga aeolica]WGS65722.1 asparagine synthase (glutamine-hydrolyzing) [Marinitoga aeolica]